MRSKGEAIIIDVLWQRHIPFYYEKKLILFDEKGQKVVVYPDITILLSQRELLLWEHNGMLSNEEYRRRNNRKMVLYFHGCKMLYFCSGLSRFSTRIETFSILVEFSVGDEVFFPFRPNVIKC